MSNKQELNKIAKEIAQIKKELTASEVPDLKKHIQNLVNWQAKQMKDSLESEIKSIKSGYYDEEVEDDAKYIFEQLMNAGHYYMGLDESYAQDRWYNEQWSPIFEYEQENIMDPMAKKQIVPLFKKYLPVIHKMLVERYGNDVPKPNYDIYHY